MIDFAAINRELLPQAKRLLAEWLPAGKLRGKEWVCGSLKGDAGESCSTNTETGSGADFASGEKWHDLVGLYAQINSMSPSAAARALAPQLCNGHDKQAGDQSLVAALASSTRLPPSPPDTGNAVAVYCYTPVFYVARYEKPDGSKSFTPFSWNGSTWNKKAPAKPRPLYGLDGLAERPDARVLVVEGEKTADAAANAIRGYCVVTWPGGAQAFPHADWAPLHGRQVDIWPDADDPGRKAGLAISALLLPHCAEVRIIDTTDAPAPGWDIADAVADGWDTARLVAWGRERLQPLTMPEPEQKSAQKPPAAPKAGADISPGSDQPAYVLWEQLQLGRNDRGPFATEANALRIIASHPSYSGRIWLDEFGQRLMIDTDAEARLFSRTDAIAALVWMQEALQLPKMPLSAVERACVLVGERNKRHPVRDWLESLTWDNIQRLAGLLPFGFGAPQNPYIEAVGRCWFMQMVARIYQPGCKADYVPVFEGAQGIRKSSALALIGGPWFLETTTNPVKNPDKFLQNLQGKWLIEIPEIDRIGGKHGDLSDLTGMITIRNDTYRMPYAPTSMDYPRQCIFTGTANRSSNWQPDETGGRRYWPVATTDIDLDWLADSREQLFAEAVARYKAGEAWWDVPADDAYAEQEQRRLADEWESVIERFITEAPDRRDWRSGPIWYARQKPLEFLTVSSVLEDALGLPESKWDMASQKRVVRCMNALGLTRQRPTIDGKRTWVYAKPNTFTANGSGK